MNIIVKLVLKCHDYKILNHFKWPTKKKIFFFKTFANKYFKNPYLSFFGFNLSIKVNF